MQLLAAGDPGDLAFPNFAASVLRAVQNGQALCPGDLLNWNLQNQPFLYLTDVQPAYILSQCPMDGNKKYCFLATPEGEAGAAVGIVYAPHADKLMVRSLPSCL
jgi:hypothetical protein